MDESAFAIGEPKGSKNLNARFAHQRRQDNRSRAVGVA